MARLDAVIATRRFGLGARPGDLERIASDPRAYALWALEQRDAALLRDPALPPSHEIFAQWRRLAKAVRDNRAASQNQASADARRRRGAFRRRIALDEAELRMGRAASTDAPLLERLVQFWSNHFTVSAAKQGALRVAVGAFEREAIRPHVLGRFADMLRAAEQHPAMLTYLDGARSIGPNSPAGRRRGKGLNENQAREILELHTVGVEAGYEQADVAELARLLTGWSVAGLNSRRAEPGRFFFNPRRHEPGARRVMGRRYRDTGLEAGEAALEDLARHPATARRVATRLARHFVGDAVPAGVIDALARRFQDTDGDLREVCIALVQSEEAWRAPPAKLLPPYDLVIALARGFDLRPPIRPTLKVLQALGQPLWAAPSPAGWPDEDDAWASPSAFRERLRVAARAAEDVEGGVDPRRLGPTLLGPALSEQARLAIARAETRAQGLALLMMSPGFQRR